MGKVQWHGGRFVSEHCRCQVEEWSVAPHGKVVARSRNLFAAFGVW